jgi:PAS domain S-box-containing protein
MRIDAECRRLFLQIFIPIALLVAAATFAIGQSRVNEELSRAGSAESSEVRLGTEAIIRSIKKVPTHVRSLQKEIAVRRAIDLNRPDALAGMIEAFTTLLQRNPEYGQARWIDETGRERVRVARLPTAGNGQGGMVEALPRQELRLRDDQAYFRTAAELGPDQIYVSPLDLGTEPGDEANAARRTIRFAVPALDDDGERRGILVIDYAAKPMLDDFAALTDGNLRHVFLIDAEGRWLASPNPEDALGFTFGGASRIQEVYPTAWINILNAASAQVLGSNGLWTWRRIVLQGRRPGLDGDLVGPTWIVVSHLPAEDVAAIRRGIWLPAAGIAGLLLLAFAGMSLRLAQRAAGERQAFAARLAAEAAAQESTARLMALEQAQQVQSQLAAIVNSSQDAIVGKNLHSVITSWNAAAERLFGYTAEEAIGASVLMLIPPERHNEEQNFIRRIAAGDTVSQFQTRRVRRDGTQLDVSVSISPIRDATGRIVGASKIARDITEWKRNQRELEGYRLQLEELVERRTAQIRETAEQLREREKLITAVADNIPGVVGYWDQELRCRFANRGYTEWFGRAPDELVGRTMEEVFDAGLLAAVNPVMQDVLRGEPRHAIRQIVKPGGETGWLSVDYIPDFKDGAVIGFFVLAIDVTRQKQAEGELRLANDRLTDALALAQDANRAKGHFLANMSHEIRTPMNGVIGMLELLGHTALDGEQMRMVGTINSSAQSLLQIINDILDFSKIDAGQLKIEMLPTDVAEVVESTVRLFVGAAAGKDLTLRCFVAPAIRGRYVVDPVRLRQILSNLLSNAIKFTAQGGVTVTVGTGVEETDWERLSFSVSDTGIGIGAATLERLFQPFTQADDSTARRFGGTGLGLSISLRLAELMGGSLALQSTEGKGTEATLTLPARIIEEEEGAAPEDMPYEQEDVDLRGVRVLVLSPDPIERRYLTGSLAHWGAAVRSFAPQDLTRETAPGAFDVCVAAASRMQESRTLVSRLAAASTTQPRHFVFYVHDDLPADENPEPDAILTTALARARLVTAVAVAAGRRSPETELVRPLPEAGVRRQAPTRDEAIRQNRLILLAEDHPVNREVILRQLKLLGFVADAVEDGAAALVALAKTRYGLLLTDCNMPVMDGFALTRAVREMEAPEDHLPIVALTANALAGEDQRCLAAGMDDYLSKPVEMKTLQRRLDRWLDRSKPVATTLAREAEATDGLVDPADAAAPTVDIADKLDEIDLSLLAEYCGGDAAAIRETLTLYVDSLAADLGRLESAVAARDAEQSAMFAHRIKGSARAVGGQQLAAVSEALERAAGARDWNAVAINIEPLRGGIARIAVQAREAEAVTMRRSAAG